MPEGIEFALVLLAPCALLGGAALELLFARLCSARAKGVIAVLACLPALIAVASLLGQVQESGAVDLRLFRWDGPLVLAIRVDALSLLFAGMGVLLGGLVLLYSIAYMAEERAATRFYATMLVFIGGFVALVFSANLFLLYLWWEVIGLCSFSLVGFWFEKQEAVVGARKVLLMTHIAGYGLLAAILLLYHRTGSALWTDPSVQHAFSTGIFLLMLLALVAKSVQVPLHTWIPDAMAAPTPVSSLLHAACYVTAGVYLAARMHSFAPWSPLWSAALVLIGTLTIAVGVMYAMVQNDLKRMLAFSTVSQIGYMMLGIGIGTPLAITGGLLHCLNHGFFKGGLFLEAGAVQHATGTRDMNSLGGLAARMPRTTLWWLIGVGNMAGIPMTSGFVSKWLLYAAALQAGWMIPATVALLASLGTVFLCLKATTAVFLGPATESTRNAHEAPGVMQWGMGLLALGSVVLGIAPQLAVNYLLNPTLAVFGLHSDLQVAWFGMFAGAGAFYTMGGLVLALVSLVAGGGLYALAFAARPVRTQAVVAAGTGGGVFTGGEPLSSMGRLTARDFSDLFEHHWSSFFRSTNVDRLYLRIWTALRKAATAAARWTAPLELHATVLLAACAAASFLACGWLLPRVPLAADGYAATPRLILAACSAAAMALLAALWVLEEKRKFAPLAIVTCGAELAGLISGFPSARLGFLEFGALLSVLLVWKAAETRHAGKIYLVAIAISAASLVGAELFTNYGYTSWARASLLLSVCVKLAAVPFFFWLLRIADEIPAVVLGIVIAVIDMAAMGDVLVLAQDTPHMFAPRALWVGIALATSLLASLLMLAQRSLKRLLVLSTVEDAGFLLLGVSAGTVLGLRGAIAAVATHSVAKALLFASLVSPEENGALSEPQGGLATRYPVSAFGFLFGMLAMLGVPPTLGYVGRWRLYSAALDMNGWILAVMIIASAMALLAYVRALTTVWWGSSAIESDHPFAVAQRVPAPPLREPWMLRIVLMGLVALLLIAGLMPETVAHLVQGGRL